MMQLINKLKKLCYIYYICVYVYYVYYICKIRYFIIIPYDQKDRGNHYHEKRNLRCKKKAQTSKKNTFEEKNKLDEL